MPWPPSPPLTRARAGRERVPDDLMLEYYTQRAAAGLIPAEAVIAFGRPFLSNPDLVERFAHGWTLNPPAAVTTWSAPTAGGYTDFPFHPQG